MKNRVKEIDALRGIAAILVVLFHHTFMRTENLYFIKYGVTGVDLFFIISGFVIFMSFQNIQKGIEFVINRISRLYPTYWASVTFTAILYGILGKLNLIDYLANMTMFQFYLKIPNLDGVYWTMTLEMLFYIGMLGLFQLKLFDYIIWIFGGICFTIVFVTYFWYNIKVVQMLIWWIPIFQFLPLFFAGIVFYKIFNNQGKNIYFYFIILFCFFSQLFLFQCAGHSRYVMSQLEYSLVLSIYFLIFILFVNAKLGFIVNKITLYFGKISFALYLTHGYLASHILFPFYYNKMEINVWVVSFFIAFPISVIVATLITYFVEIPLSKKLKEMLINRFII